MFTDAIFSLELWAYFQSEADEILIEKRLLYLNA